MKQRTFQFCWYYHAIPFLFLIILTLFPLFRWVWLFSHAGAGTPSTDDVWFMPFLDQALSGKGDLRGWADAAFQNGHFTFFPLVVEWTFASLTHWNIQWVVFFGLFLAFLKLILLKSLLSPPEGGFLSLLLWPVLSFLVFSTSQMSLFEHDYYTLTSGLHDLGMLVGIWGLCRFPGKGGLFWMVLGGWIASWAYAAGPLSWILYFFALLLLGHKRIRDYLVWFLAALFSSLPYVYFLVLHPKPGQPGASYLNFRLLVEGVGWPFTQNFIPATAEGRGWVGLFLLASALLLFFLMKKRKEVLRPLIPSLLLVLFGLLNIFQVAVFRGGVHLAGPWYSRPFMFFWVGLVGAAAFLLWKRKDGRGEGRLLFWGMLMWPSCFFICLGYFYLTSNLSYADKSVFLSTRAPVSASCLREYRSAPTYCEEAVFVWKNGQWPLFTLLASPLERHRLSVFAPRQSWTLQGDVILGKVHFHEAEGVRGVFWSNDLEADPVSFLDYRHLNLFLHAPSSVEWELRLPEHLKSARFRSALAVSRSAPDASGREDGFDFQISVVPEGGKEQVLFLRKVSPQEKEWKPFEVDLSSFHGKKVVLHFGADHGKNTDKDWAVLRYPSLDLVLEERSVEDGEQNKEGLAPSNTDLSDQFPKATTLDLTLNLPSEDSWEISGLRPSASEEKTWAIAGDPFMVYREPLNACLSDYPYFSIRASISPESIFKVIKVFLQLNDQPGYQKNISIPLLVDGKEHAYSYPTAFLDLDAGDRLTGLRWAIPAVPGNIAVSDIRFIHGGTSHCVEPIKGLSAGGNMLIPKKAR